VAVRASGMSKGEELLEKWCHLGGARFDNF
jgi:hypothetical protein